MENRLFLFREKNNDSYYDSPVVIVKAKSIDDAWVVIKESERDSAGVTDEHYCVVDLIDCLNKPENIIWGADVI